MSFDLFGFDIIPSDDLYGVWFFSTSDWETEDTRALFSIYWAKGGFIIDLFWAHIL